MGEGGSRAQMLGAIRRGLHRGELPEDQKAVLRTRLREHPRHLIPARSRIPHDQQIDLFAANLEREFATHARASAASVPAAIAEYLAGLNLPAELRVAPHPELRALPWNSRPLLTVTEGRATGLETASVQHGYAGIAETGTLMLPSAPDRPTTLNLLPDTAIVVLRTARIVGAYEEAWDLLRAEHVDARTGGALPRNVMFVTGPSRSADIENVLELGAHGPRRLHVVLVDDA